MSPIEFALALYNDPAFRRAVYASTVGPVWSKDLWRAAYSKARYEMNNRWYDLPEHPLTNVTAEPEPAF